MAAGTPSNNAFRFVLENQQGEMFDAYLDLVAYADFSVIDARYKKQGDTSDKWTFLWAREFDESALSSESGVRTELDRILTTYINPAIEATFGIPGQEAPKPGEGWELVVYVISNSLSESGNVISLT